MIHRIYIYFAALLVRAIVAYCTKRRRYVDYVHSEPQPYPAYENFRERVYMRRYVLTGFMTGDTHPNALLSFTHGPGPWGRVRYAIGQARRWFALNRWHLYLHHMHAPDADECLHDHPWPWGLSFVLLGGYLEERPAAWALPSDPIAQLALADALHAKARFGDVPKGARWLHAPALNRLRGTTFHRISALDRACATGCSPARGRVPGCTSPSGTFTLFLAGPRRASKQWGYLVPGRGYVNQRERHAEMGASERRAEPDHSPITTGKSLDALALCCYGIARRKRYLWIFRESDKSLRGRCAARVNAINANAEDDLKESQIRSFRNWFERRAGQ